MRTDATSTIPQQSPWIASARWDAAWIFAGLWGLLLLPLGLWAQAAPLLLALLLVLERTLSVAHSWSTSYMVLFSPLLAEVRRADPLRFVVAPLGLVALCMGLGYWVAAEQRFGPDGRFDLALWPFALYLTLFWAGHFWHFGNQDFGVLTIYRQKAGQDQPRDRRIDRFYTIAMMFLIQPIVYFSVVQSTAVAELVHTLLPLPRSVRNHAADVAVAFALLLSAAALGYERSRPRPSLPKTLYLLVIASHPLLLWASVRAGRTDLAWMYVVTYLWSHWLIATGLVLRINSRAHQARGDSPRRARLRHIATIGAITGAVMFATGAHTEFFLFYTDGFRYKDLLASITPAMVPWVGALFGFFLAEQVLHYYCDRRLFRFRQTEVRRRVAPLLFGSDASPSAPAAPH